MSNLKKKEIYLYLFTISLCITILFILLGKVDFSIPLVYSGDGLLNLVWIKTIVDQGWYLHNSFLGAPFYLEMYDFPMSEGFNFILLKIIALLTGNASITINSYYVLTYILIVSTSLYVMRSFKLGVPVSIVGSLLFTFLPYHFQRGEWHLFLSGYYMVPLITMIIFWIKDGKLSKQKWIASLVIMGIVGSSGIYYAYFACIFFIVIGVISCINNRNIKLILFPSILVLFVIMVGIINISPTIIYKFNNGANMETAKRTFVESELYGLKLTHLLMPVTNHRINILANIKNNYILSAPLNNENTIASLGIFGSSGLFILLFLLFIRCKDETLKILSSLNLSAILLASIGGIGTIIGLTITSQIRAYNRISVFIAFFSILAICILINKWKTKWIYVISIILLVCGVYDQTSKNFNPQTETARYAFKNDKRFVSQIEKEIPPASLVFQLPYMAFPENGPTNNMIDYDPAKLYIHSIHTKWSYGAMKGREQDKWLRNISKLDTREMVQKLSFGGFNGITIDKYGYQDNAESLIIELTNLLKIDPMYSDDGRILFFSMLNYNENLRGKYNQDEWERKADEVLHPVTVDWGSGFYGLEADNTENWRWASQQGKVIINNASNVTRKITIEMILKTGYPSNSDLFIKSDLLNETVKVNYTGLYYKKEMDIPPGKHFMTFESTSERIISQGDTRNLVFRVINFKLRDK